jgi:sortase A
MAKANKVLSYVLLAAGAVLLFFGAREWLESRFGQSAAERQFDTGSPAQPGGYNPPQLGDAVAKLIIPRLDTELYVVEGDGPNELRRGPGHLMGTAMPGQDGNCVIAGHRDTHFRPLKDIHKGDEIVLDTQNGQYVYRVQSTEVISPENTAPLRPTTDAELNLITCYPFYYVGSAPKRFVVQAHLTGSMASLPRS